MCLRKSTSLLTDSELKKISLPQKPNRDAIACIFNHSFFLGGGEISFYELIRLLGESQFKPLAIIPDYGEIGNQLNDISIPVEICFMPSIRKPFTGNPFLSLARLTKLLKEKNIALIHANGSRACLYAGLSGKLLNIPVIWHVRETKTDYSLYDGLLGFLSRKIICVSKSVSKKRFGRFGHWLNNKIVTVYNGVDPIKFTPKLLERKRIRNHLEVNGGLLFGSVGNIIYRKGYDVFIKAMVEVVLRRPELNIKFIMMGHILDEPYYKSLKELSSSSLLKDKIIFHPYSRDVASYLSAMDVFVMPSRSEGFSRALLEAMCFGLPVIASKISEIEEAVSNDVNGILVPVGNIHAMADAIIKMTKNHPLRRSMGGMNKEKIIRLFSLEKHTQQIQQIYRLSLVN